MNNFTKFTTLFAVMGLVASALTLAACGQRKPLKAPDDAHQDTSSF